MIFDKKRSYYLDLILFTLVIIFFLMFLYLVNTSFLNLNFYKLSEKELKLINIKIIDSDRKPVSGVSIFLNDKHIGLSGSFGDWSCLVKNQDYDLYLEKKYDLQTFSKKAYIKYNNILEEKYIFRLE